MRFKEFLQQESGVLAHRQVPAKMSMEDMMEWIENNSMHHIRRGAPIFRGVNTVNSVEGLYNATQMNRHAANTANYYNLWIDNHSDWSAFPKRAKSFICSTDDGKASEYGDVYVVIPQDSSDIGICPRSDIWQSFRAIYKLASFNGMDAFMKFTQALKDMANMAGNPERDWDLFAAMLNKIDLEVIKADRPNFRNKTLAEVCDEFTDYMTSTGSETAYQAFEKIFDPKKNDFSIQKASGFSAPIGREVWMSGGILMIEHPTYMKILKEFGL